MRSERLRNAAVKQGAAPNSPMVIAEVSTVVTAPAPISRSACRPLVGTQTRCRLRMPRRASARVAAIATPEVSFGTARSAPSGIDAASVSREVREVALMIVLLGSKRSGHYGAEHRRRLTIALAGRGSGWGG